jgi:RNA polymerase sigma factor (sigma-70 family)
VWDRFTAIGGASGGRKAPPHGEPFRSRCDYTVVTDANDEARGRAAMELLVIRCQLGEREAFDALVERWHGPLWSFIRRAAGDDAVAEDILQDAWLRIVRGLGRLSDPARLAPWLFSIARRAVIDHIRRRSSRPAAVELEEEAHPAAEPPPDDWEEIELVQDAVADLSPADRETVALFYLQELDLREIAEVLAIPVGTVKSRLHRARGLLRKHLEAKGVMR